MCKVHSIELSKLFTLKSCVVVHAQLYPADFFSNLFILQNVFSQQKGKVGAEPQNNKEEGNWTKWFMQRIRLEFKRILFIFFESCNESSDLSIFTNFLKISCFSFIIIGVLIRPLEE